MRWAVIGLLVAASAGSAQDEPLTLTAEQAMLHALRENPELAAQRQRLGIAAADVVIARSLLENPTYQGEVHGASGPPGEVTNSVPNSHAVLFTVQHHSAKDARRQAAGANLSRVEWEIVHQETRLALAVYRAVHEILYQQQRLALAEKIVSRTGETEEQFKRLQQALKVSPIDLLMIRNDLMDAKAQVQTSRQGYLKTWQELRRLLGLPAAALAVQGSLDAADVVVPLPELEATAARQRADLQAAQAAVAEAEAQLRLERANRWGNPSVGPAYEYNEARVNFIGAQFSMPIPINTKRGEIMRREAELAKAILEARQKETDVALDVRAALEQLRQAEAEVELYRDDLLPAVREALTQADKLVKAGVGDADVYKLLDFYRRAARAEEGFLTARWNLVQARAALAAAVGDISLVGVAAHE